ncbi:hypothetical protein Q0F99_08435 [Rathayibacter oskolensis]|nr:hypothetical protein [Rathayibacter oskolensis]WKK72885.1 hypothetical protein Q0F99_08435 [Rathayibacter oskolensis]
MHSRYTDTSPPAWRAALSIASRVAASTDAAPGTEAPTATTSSCTG